MKKKLVFLFLLTSVFQAQISLSQTSEEQSITPGQQLAMLSKPAVVRVFSGCSASYSYGDYAGTVEYLTSGTAFIIDPNGYVVTNSHVVNKDDCQDGLRDEVALKELGESSAEKIKEEAKLTNIKYDQKIMLSPRKMLNFEIMAEGDSKDVAILKIEIKNAPVLKIGDSDSVKLGDTVAVIGYPGAADFDLNLLSDDELDALGQATVSLDGKISNQEKIIPEYQTPVLQLDGITAARGSSGSPVLNSDGQVVGMITFAKSDDIATIPFAITSDTIQTYVRSAGASLEESNTNIYYREGLEAYRKRNYPEAKKKFEAVLGLYEYHLDAQTKLDEIAQKGAEEYTTKSYRIWLTMALGGAALLAAGYAFAKYRMKESFVSTGPMDSFMRLDEEPSTRYGTQEPRATSDTLAHVPASSPTIMADQPYITLKDPQGRVAKFDLTQPRYTLGRGQNCDLRLPDDWQLVSKQHATRVIAS